MRKTLCVLESELEGENFVCNGVVGFALIKLLQVNTPHTHKEDNLQNLLAHMSSHRHGDTDIMKEAQVGAGSRPRTRPPLHSLNPS